MLCSELEAMDQPQTSAPAQVGDDEEYTQVLTNESVSLSKPQELQVSPQSKGEPEKKSLSQLSILNVSMVSKLPLTFTFTLYI